MHGYGYGYGFKLVWLWVWFQTRPTPVPYLATSSVAPAPCSARARPCLDVWWGEPSLVQHPLCWPARPGSHGRCRAREITVWYCEATSGFGVRGFGWAPAPVGVRPVLATCNVCSVYFMCVCTGDWTTAKLTIVLIKWPGARAGERSFAAE